MKSRDRLISLPQVEELTGIKKTLIYRLIKRGEFPQQFKPGGHSSRWSEREVLAWREAQRKLQT